MTPTTYRPTPDAEPVHIVQACPRAMEFFMALRHALDRESDLEKAQFALPGYMPTSSPIDHYGAELSAFNKAVNELGDLVGLTT